MVQKNQWIHRRHELSRQSPRAVHNGLDDGTILIAGDSKTWTAGGSTNTYLLKLNSTTGDVLSTKRIYGAGSTYVYDLEVSSDGSLVIAGNSYSCAGTSDMLLIKVSSDWSTIDQSITFGEDAVVHEYGQAIHETSDGGYVFCGNRKVSDSDTIVLMKLNNDFSSVVWAKMLGLSTSADFVYDVIPAKNDSDSFVFVGRTSMVGTENDVIISKFSPLENRNFFCDDAGTTSLSFSNLNDWGNFIKQDCAVTIEDETFSNIEVYNVRTWDWSVSNSWDVLQTGIPSEVFCNITLGEVSPADTSADTLPDGPDETTEATDTSVADTSAVVDETLDGSETLDETAFDPQGDTSTAPGETEMAEEETTAGSAALPQYFYYIIAGAGGVAGVLCLVFVCVVICIAVCCVIVKRKRENEDFDVELDE